MAGKDPGPIAGQVFRKTADDSFGLDVERAIFLTVLHHLFTSGSDRSCEKWKRLHVIRGTEELSLHQLYRAMSFLGEVITGQDGATSLAPRCMKDIIEEDLHFAHPDLLMELDLVFFDTTSIHIEGNGGETLGQREHSKDHRPDLKQMIVGVVVDYSRRSICCELWPGNTADVKTMIPIVDHIRNRFHINRFCIVSDHCGYEEAT